MLRVLRQNLDANGAGDWTVLHEPLGAAEPDGMTVDRLRLPRLEWIKVDATGLGGGVVAGAADTLWRLRPRLFVAAADLREFDALASTLREFGYRCWLHESPLCPAGNFNGRAAEVLAGRTALALVAIPEESDDGGALPGTPTMTRPARRSAAQCAGTKRREPHADESAERPLSQDSVDPDLIRIGDATEELRRIAAEIRDQSQTIDARMQDVRGFLDYATAVGTATSAIRLIDFDLAHHPRYADPKRLVRSFAQVNSQNGEDGIIHEIFRRVGPASRVFVEVGVGDGTENNTAFLLAPGLAGLLDRRERRVPGRPGRAPRPPGRLPATLVARVDRDNAAGLFRKLGVPAEFDLLSLDIDQNTYYAWEGLHEFRPRVVVVEYNAAIPPDVDWKVRYDPGREWDYTQNFGASLKAFEHLGRRLGYCLVGCDFCGVNAFFVRRDLAAGPLRRAVHRRKPLRAAALPALPAAHRRAILDRADGSPRAAARTAPGPDPS